MKEIVHLPQNYFELYAANEDQFRKKYEGAYFSRPVLYEKEGKGIAVAPWGTPGWVSPVIFPYAHFITVTNIEQQTVVYHIKDLLQFLMDNYNVIEHDRDPIPHIIIEMPDFLSDANKENEFWDELRKVPTVKN